MQLKLFNVSKNVVETQRLETVYPYPYIVGTFGMLSSVLFIHDLNNCKVLELRSNPICMYDIIHLYLVLTLSTLYTRVKLLCPSTRSYCKFFAQFACQFVCRILIRISSTSVFCLLIKNYLVARPTIREQQ